MPHLRRAAVAAAALAASACADPGPLPRVPPPAEAHANAQARQVFEALRPLVGDAPLECNSNLRRGQVPRVGTATPIVLAQWFACADAARSARRPFLIVLEQPPFEGGSSPGWLGFQTARSESSTTTRDAARRRPLPCRLECASRPPLDRIAAASMASDVPTRTHRGSYPCRSSGCAHFPCRRSWAIDFARRRATGRSTAVSK